jgi:hypothetical protein
MSVSRGVFWIESEEIERELCYDRRQEKWWGEDKEGGRWRELK